MFWLDWLVLGAYGVAGIVAFFMMAADKWKASHDRWRIPEKTLLLWCACFGATGGLLGMRMFRHKTYKRKFSIGVPAMMLAQLALFIVYFSYWR